MLPLSSQIVSSFKLLNINVQWKQNGGDTHIVFGLLLLGWWSLNMHIYLMY
jgi:hypothetical protein